MNSIVRVLCAVAFLGMASIGRADLIMNVQSVVDAAGSTGNTLDVTMTNTDPFAITNLYSFDFGLSGPGTFNLIFTGASTATLATYIFSDNSQFGPDIGQTNGQTLSARDNVLLPIGSSIGAGATVGLAHITFNLSPAAPPGPIPLTVFKDLDSLLRLDDSPVPFSVVNGTVTVTSATPEPATSVLVGLALTGLLGAVHRFRRLAKKLDSRPLRPASL
jgi:hypothetical protein